jgi:propanediol dehydratase large subunit
MAGTSCCVGVVPSCSNSESVSISVAEFSSTSYSSLSESVDVYSSEPTFDKRKDIL